MTDWHTKRKKNKNTHPLSPSLPLSLSHTHTQTHTHKHTHTHLVFSVYISFLHISRLFSPKMFWLLNSVCVRPFFYWTCYILKGRDENVSLTSTMKKSVVGVDHQRRPVKNLSLVDVNHENLSLSLSLSLTNDILAERAWAWVVWDSLGFVGLFLNFTFVIMRGPNKLLKLKILDYSVNQIHPSVLLKQ